MLDLPEHHATLLSLHSAVEHALVVHLATAGTAGSAIQEEASEQEGALPTLRIPELISYTTLRPLVERSCGRRLGRDELARLVWLWGADAAAAKEGRSNLGFEITRSGSGHSSAGHATSSSQRNLGFLADGTRRGAADYMLGLRMRIDDGDDNDSDDEGMSLVHGSAHDRRPPKTPPMKQKITRTPGSRNDPPSPSPSPRFVQSPFLTRGRFAPDGSPSQFGRPSTPPSSATRKPFGSPSSSTSSPARRSRQHSGGSEQAFLDAANDVVFSSQGGSSPSVSVYARRGISLVALWNNGMRRRKREVRRRLVASLEEQSHGREVKAESQIDVFGLAISMDGNDRSIQKPTPATPQKRQIGAIEGVGGLLTPSNSREDDHRPGSKRIKRDPAMLLPGVNFGAEEASTAKTESETPAGSPSVPKALLPGDADPLMARATFMSGSSAQSPPSPSKPTRVEAARMAHRANIAQTEASLGRPLTLTERIRAKQDTAKRGLGRGAADNADNNGSTSASSIAAAARRRANLSRLQDVAESIYMLFAAGASSGGKAAMPARTALASSPFDDHNEAEEPATASSSLMNAAASSAPIPLPDVLRAICQSSKIPMGTGEARDAITRLGDIAPGFVEVVPVGARHWVRLLGQVQLPKDEDDNPLYNAQPALGVLGAVRRCIRIEMDRTPGAS